MNIKVSIGIIVGLLVIVLWGMGCSQGFSSSGSLNSPVPVPGVAATPVRPLSDTGVPTQGISTPAPADVVRPPATLVTPTSSSQPTTQVDLIPQGQAGRSHAANNVTIEASLQGKWLTGSKEMIFKVVMDTHSVDLDVYDLAALAILRDSQGREFKPLSWKAPKGGHHREGVLTFSADQTLLSTGTTYVELFIKDVAGVPHSLRWDLRSASS